MERGSMERGVAIAVPRLSSVPPPGAAEGVSPPLFCWIADQARCGVDVVDRQSLGCPRLLGKGKFLAFRYIRNRNDPALFSISYHWEEAVLSQDGLSPTVVAT
jgi:hypothetical protein